MDDRVEKYPELYPFIFKETKDYGFDQLGDEKMGSLLAALCASKPGGTFLELGTGTGLSTCWMLEGMCESSTLLTVDNDRALLAIAKKYLDSDPRVNIVSAAGEELIANITPASIDLIFADTWPGKYFYLDETLNLLKAGGLYIIDDMLPQENWPEGHEVKANELVKALSNRKDLTVTKLCWSSGVLICCKTA